MTPRPQTAGVVADLFTAINKRRAVRGQAPLPAPSRPNRRAYRAAYNWIIEELGPASPWIDPEQIPVGGWVDYPQDDALQLSGCPVLDANGIYTHHAASPLEYRNGDWQYFPGASFYERLKKSAVAYRGPRGLFQLHPALPPLLFSASESNRGSTLCPDLNIWTENIAVSINSATHGVALAEGSGYYERAGTLNSAHAYAKKQHPGAPAWRLVWSGTRWEIQEKPRARLDYDVDGAGTTYLHLAAKDPGPAGNAITAQLSPPEFSSPAPDEKTNPHRVRLRDGNRIRYEPPTDAAGDPTQTFSDRAAGIATRINRSGPARRMLAAVAATGPEAYVTETRPEQSLAGGSDAWTTRFYLVFDALHFDQSAAVISEAGLTWKDAGGEDANVSISGVAWIPEGITSPATLPLGTHGRHHYASAYRELFAIVRRMTRLQVDYTAATTSARFGESDLDDPLPTSLSAAIDRALANAADESPVSESISAYTEGRYQSDPFAWIAEFRVPVAVTFTIAGGTSSDIDTEHLTGVRVLRRSTQDLEEEAVFLFHPQDRAWLTGDQNAWVDLGYKPLVWETSSPTTPSQWPTEYQVNQDPPNRRVTAEGAILCIAEFDFLDPTE